LKALTYAVPFAFLATAALGCWLKGPWSYLTVAATPLVLCSLDPVLRDGAPGSGEADGALYRVLPVLYIALQIALTLAVAVWAAAAKPAGPDLLGATLSVGLTSGVFGLLAAHEMVHKSEPGAKAAGLAMLAAVSYMHFEIAHIHGHHRQGATVADPASARSGEGAYAFVARSVRGQWREAWRFEAERLRRSGRPFFGPANRMLVYLAVEVALLLVAAAAGPATLIFVVGQAVIAIVMLELFNYIAHYGLSRRRDELGRLERLGPQHCWNSSRRFNNWSLFNMGRHGDHHRRPMASYQTLVGDIHGPELPTGYAGAVLLALLPPLWRKVMDPRAAIWAKSGSDADALGRAAAEAARLPGPLKTLMAWPAPPEPRLERN
jgi:alkane 1-monooxygenase